VQVCDFLQADARPAAEQYCASLVRGNRAAPSSWQLLKSQPMHVQATIMGNHPLIADSSQDLAAILPRLPKCVGVAATLTRCTQRRRDVPPGSANPHPVTLWLDISAKTIVKEVPVLLAARLLVTKVQAVKIGTLRSYVDSAAENPQASNQPLPGCGALAAAVFANLELVTSFSLGECPPEAAEALAAVTQLTGLTFLSIACAKAPPAALTRQLAPALQQLPTLLELHLFHAGWAQRQGIQTSPFSSQQQPSGVQLAHGIAALTALTNLTLHRWYADAAEASKLGKAIAKLPALGALDVTGFQVSPGASAQQQVAAFDAFACGLSGCSVLTRLDFEQNSHKLQEAELPRMLAGMTRLRRLNMVSATVTGGHERCLAGFVPALGQLTDLHYLNIGSYGAPPASAAHAFVAMTQLRCLCLRQRESAAAGESVGHAIAGAAPGLAASLLQLDLAGLQLSSAGVRVLAHGISQLTKLQILDITDASVDAESAATLAAAFKYTPDLRRFECGTGVADRRTVNILALMQRAPPIGPAAVAALAPGLATLPRLHLLSVAGTDMDCSNLDELLQVCAQLPRLRSLDISRNPRLDKAALPVLEQRLPDLTSLLDLTYSGGPKHEELDDVAQLWSRLRPDACRPGPGSFQVASAEGAGVLLEHVLAAQWDTLEGDAATPDMPVHPPTASGTGVEGMISYATGVTA
jgi:hypothetical protein